MRVQSSSKFHERWRCERNDERRPAHIAPPPATTDDHVPPKGLFAKPYPTLITVPSCDGHNSGNSKDDEYFRLALTVRQDIEQQRDAHAAQQAALRALARPQARGLLASFLGNTRAVELRTPGGLYLGNGGLYTPDIRRVCAVAQRTALGLFYHDVGHRLPDEYEADTCLLPSRLDATGDEAESYAKIVLPLIHSVCDQSPRFVGKPVLTRRERAADFFLLLGFRLLAVIEPAQSGRSPWPNADAVQRDSRGLGARQLGARSRPSTISA
jgi:hypothetical protein